MGWEETINEFINDINVKRTKDKKEPFALPRDWINSCYMNVMQICIVTHPLKFTHAGLSKGGCFIGDNVKDDYNGRYISTATLKTKSYDVSGNAAALPLGKFLLLNYDGKKLLDVIISDDSSVLGLLANDGTELQSWMNTLKKVIETAPVASDTYIKQVYFPLSEDGYHLLSPLYSSSLADKLFTRINNHRFSEEYTEARKLRKNGKYSDQTIMEYPDLAVIKFGGTKPQNVSLLNSQRGGKSYLLPAYPPRWDKTEKPPKDKDNAFFREFEKRSRYKIRDLRSYLLSVLDKESTASIRNKRAEYVDDIIDIFIQYSAEIRNMTEWRGWSASSKLDIPERLWLDPLNNDTEFQKERVLNKWQEKIAEKFARFLNQNLKRQQNGKSLPLSDIEFEEWYRLIYKALQQMEAALEMSL